MKQVYFLIFVFCFFSCQQKELLKEQPAATIKSNPDSVQIITSDIPLFWEMYDAEIPLFTVDELEEQYFYSGSNTLASFYKHVIQSPEEMPSLLNSWIDRQYYDEIREQTRNIDDQKKEIHAAFKAFKKLLPEAVFTDVYIVVGALNSGGVVLPGGQIVIAAEMFSRAPDTDVDYLSSWLQSTLRGPEYIPAIAVHELVHLQQQRFAGQEKLQVGGQTLLDRALLEGSADFITHLILEKYLNDKLLAYADPVEEKLWTEFSKKMHRRNWSGWLYNGNTTADKPADLGYYIGFKIAERYYRNAGNKNEAIRAILHIKDSRQFLEDSRYGDSFE